MKETKKTFLRKDERSNIITLGYRRECEGMSSLSFTGNKICLSETRAESI